MSNLDEYELQMLRILQAEGRKPISELAAEVGLSTTPCARRFDALRKAGVIESFSARVDRRAVGLGIEVFVGVSLTTHDGELPQRFRERIRRHPAVIACWAVTGDQDFLLNVMLEDVEALNRFLMRDLMRIEGVRDVRTNLVLDNVKPAVQLPLDHLAPA